MKKIDSTKIQDTVYQLTLDANIYLRKDVKDSLQKSLKKETSSLSRRMLEALIKNYQIAESKSLPICQDTGMVVVFLDIGYDIELDFKNLENNINKAVEKAYKDGFLRASVVNDPFIRENTQNNLPAIIHYNFVDGNNLKISVLIKGFGAENKSKLHMFDPTVSIKEISDYVTGVVEEAGASACPPYILGIGIGGTMDKAALMSKKALLEDINKSSEDSNILKLEEDIINKINSLKIGVMGLGGDVTCLGVNILTYPTHIAGLPVAVNVNCHALRSAEKML